MKKRYLFYVIAGLLLIAQLTVVGCKQQPKLSDDEDTEEPAPDNPCGEDVPEPKGYVDKDLQVKSIKFALFNKKGEIEPYKDEDGNVKKDDKGNPVTFEEAKCFNKTLSGFYVLEKNPETAYIAVQIDKPKPDQGGDFIVCVENENSFLDTIRLFRKNGDLFATEEAVNDENVNGNKVVALSEGENVIVVKIELDGESAEYKFNVKYDGGPKDDPKDKNQKLIPGIYCPTMRKLSQAEIDEGKKDEALLIICAAHY